MNNKDIVKWFVIGDFFKKEYDENPCISLSIHEKNDVLLAVKKAYVDMTPRNIGGLKEAHDNNKEQYENSLNSVFGTLADRFIDYFDKIPNTEKQFDNWHKKTCSDFKIDFQKFLDSQKVGYTIQYGKAQKIVNMTFKYLYCFDDAEDEYFKYCHMALDQYTLKWYNEEYDQNYRKSKEYLSSDYNYRASSGWSNLNETKYQNIQDLIRIIFDGKSPFFEEFIIWMKYKKKANK